MRTLPLGPGAPSSPGGRRTRWPHTGAAFGIIGWLVGVLFFVALPASATTSKSVDRVTFGIAPASATGPNGRSYLSYGVTPGAVLRDYVALLNYSPVPLSLQVYVTNASETPNGGFGLLPAGHSVTGVGAWVSLPPVDSTVRVNAKTSSGPGRLVVPLTVAVPDNATPGDHVGGVVVSLRTIGTNASGQNVVLLQRVGTRVFIRVAGKLAPKVTVEDMRPSYQGTLNPLGKGQVRVSYVLSNTGNVDLALNHQVVKVSGLLGSTRQTVLGGPSLFIPGASLDESVVLTGVWPEFLLHATVSAQPAAAGATAPDPVVASASATLWAIPWSPIGLLVVVVVLAIGVAFGLRARRAGRPIASQPQVVRA